MCSWIVGAGAPRLSQREGLETVCVRVCTRTCVFVYIHTYPTCISTSVYTYCQVHVTRPLLNQHHSVFTGAFMSLSMRDSFLCEKSGSYYSEYVYVLDQSLCV